MRVSALHVQRQKPRVGIDELVAHSDQPADVASKDPEMRMWDALDAGTHDDTLKDAILEHMQACPDLKLGSTIQGASFGHPPPSMVI